ncbi:MAG: hypothetical protein ACI9BD_000413 [Candidatus Marinamargulisbacteria bacterium]|jgi:hypothetical protein
MISKKGSKKGNFLMGKFRCMGDIHIYDKMTESQLRYLTEGVDKFRDGRLESGKLRIPRITGHFRMSVERKTIYVEYFPSEKEKKTQKFTELLDTVYEEILEDVAFENATRSEMHNEGFGDSLLDNINNIIITDPYG